MCVLRVHIKPSIYGKIFSKNEKTANIFSIPEKFLSKNKYLLCAYQYIYIYICWYCCGFLGLLNDSMLPSETD